ncbi:ABC transporter related protein [Denitrovibrio acetiphilus DSM 12809]|uniref:ABC transporter related protein n=1 Tax=Denitrovibrio acetiphilus (strain DSM 12809 / NBRC 114555 / N2460) TaxID=522772 RepID=D4H0X3_DENA2|nr:ABC transporter ATP-binding protein [Denitrovibrio acetiphilus]ADD68636.1 ABC transporter related protein [Denitrovibrio acetiphilus DSM 12809]
MLEVKSLYVSYGGVQALTNVSVHVKEGEFVSLIGSNGAGKTTLLNSIMNIVGRQKGSALFQGKEVSKVSTADMVTRGVALVPEGRRVFSNMSVRENLEMGGFKRPVSEVKAKLAEVTEMFPVLGDRASQMAGMLSGGEQQMLAIGRALMSAPKILLMDEPSMGLAPLVIKEVYEKLKVLAESGLTILLVEQNASIALKYAQRGYVLENGRIIMQGKASELLGDNEVKRAYLGKEYKEKWER